jgi:outer membrane protein assembly factor BamD
MARLILISLTLAIVLLTVGCSSSETADSSSPEARFNHAKALFDDREYLEAINEFTVVALQFSGSAFASEAQFYIGECRFNRGEYLLAAFEYLQLKRNYPASPRVSESQYKLALSYCQLSPKSLLDQQYTRKAIDEFQSFVEYYPGNEHAVDADARIRELTGKLAKKSIETARLYATMGYYKAAQFYYDDVIERYHDTEFGPLAYIEKTELLISRRKFDDADATISKFISLYPNNVLRSRADDLKSEVVKGLADRKKSTSLRRPEAQGSSIGKSDH